MDCTQFIGRTTLAQDAKVPFSVEDEVLKLDNQICFPLYAAGRLVAQAYAPGLERLGITYVQYLVLLVLWETDGAGVRQIGERLYLDSGTLTPVLQRLVKAGLIRRKHRATDERTVESWLTTKGRELKKRAAQLPLALFCELELDQKALLQLRDAVDDVVARLQRIVTAQGPARARK